MSHMRQCDAKPNVLLTRPEATIHSLQHDLYMLGYSVYSAPMLEIRHNAAATAPAAHYYQAIAITSANAVPALQKLDVSVDMPVFAVGDATALAAGRIGMAEVYSAGGDVQDLCALIADNCTHKAGPVLYVRGRDIAGDLQGALQATGLTVDQWIAYAAEPVPEMPEAADDPGKLAAYDAIMFFSQRTARQFASLVRGIRAENGLRHTKALCISNRVIACLDMLPWAGMHIAPRRNRGAMIELLQSYVPVS